MFGYTAEQAVGRPITIIIPADRADEEVRILERLRAGERVEHFDTMRVRSDGQPIPVSLTISPIKDEAGRVVGASKIARDITERKLAEAEIKDSEIRYRRLFQNAKDGILILGADTGKVIDANPFMSELLGYSHDEFLGKELWEIGLFRDIKESQAAYRELQDKGYVRYEHLPLESRSGQKVEVEFVSNVYAEDHHQVVQCNIRDITERSRLQRLTEEQ